LGYQVKSSDRREYGFQLEADNLKIQTPQLWLKVESGVLCWVQFVYAARSVERLLARGVRSIQKIRELDWENRAIALLVVIGRGVVTAFALVHLAVSSQI